MFRRRRNSATHLQQQPTALEGVTASGVAAGSVQQSTTYGADGGVRRLEGWCGTAGASRKGEE